MATVFFLRDLASDINPGANLEKYLRQRRGRASVNKVTNTTSGGTNISATDSAGGSIMEFYSAPITTAITISGTVTVNLRGLEAANTTNTGRGILIERTNNAGVVQSSIVADTTVPATITEFSTSDAANGAATYTPTSTAMSVGDRIKVTLKMRNVGTMGASTATYSIDGPASGAAGDSWVQFTENIVTDEPIEVIDYMGAGYYY